MVAHEKNLFSSYLNIYFLEEILQCFFFRVCSCIKSTKIFIAEIGLSLFLFYMLTINTFILSHS